MNSDRHSPFTSTASNSRSDANARLEEFNRRFDEIKSRFPSRSLFSESNIPMHHQQQSQQNASMRNDNGAGNVPPYSTNPNVDPYHNQHHYHQSYDPMNDARFNFIQDAPSFFRQRFQDTFGGRPNDYFSSDNVQSESPREHRVHHIPIHIEPRPGSGLGATSSTGGSRGASREPSPMPDYSQSQQQTSNQQAGIVPPPPQFHNQPEMNSQPNVRNVPLQYSAFPHSYHQQQQQQQPSMNEFYNKQASSASPKRVVSVPIQICKSSSSPSSTGANQQTTLPTTINSAAPTQTAELHQQAAPAPINESASDPLIADPNKVYAMSYDPLVVPEKNNNKQSEINSSKQEDDNPNKLPDVVVLSYEPQVKKQQVNLQNNAPINDTSTNNENNVNICQAETVNNQQQQTSNNNTSQQKEETPFDYVDEILRDLRNWEQQVNECQATSADDKGYKWLDEMLTLCVLRLDCINIDGNEELRKYRKNAINEVNRVVALLESKIQHNNDNDNATQHKEVSNEANTQDNNNPQENSNPSKDSNNKNNDNKDAGNNKKKEGGKRLLFFKKKNKSQQQDGQSESDTDKNNNDLKSTNEQEQQQQQTSESNNKTLIGRETEV